MVLDRALVDGIVNPEKIEDILHHVSQLTTLSSQDANYFSEKICQAVNLVLDDLLGNKEFASGILDVIWCVVGRNSLGGDAGGSLIHSLLMLALENNCPIQLLRQTMVCANQILRSKQALSAFFNISKETSSIIGESYWFIFPLFIITNIGGWFVDVGIYYETQAVILEAVFRLSNPSSRKYWAEKWFQSDQLGEQFLYFKPDQFELECRKFLNTLNSTQGSNRRVHSFICMSIIFGGYKVQKPYGSDLWVDFNLDGQSLSFYCADLNQDEQVSNSQSLWETIMLEKNIVAYCNTAFGVNQEYQLVNIQLHRPCTDLIGNNTVPSLHRREFSICGNNVLLMLPEDAIVHSLLQNIYGELYQGQVVVSSQPYDDSNEGNPNVSELETETGSNQPSTVSSTVRKLSSVVTPLKIGKNTQREKVNKNTLKNISCHTPLKEGLKSSETSRDVYTSSSKVEVKKSSVSLPDGQFSGMSLNSFTTSTPLSVSGHLNQIRNRTSDKDCTEIHIKADEKTYPCMPLGVIEHEVELMNTVEETQQWNEDLTHEQHTSVKASVILEPIFVGEGKERRTGSVSERNNIKNNIHKISNICSELSPNKVDLTKDPSNTAISRGVSDKVTHSKYILVSSNDFCNKEVDTTCATGKLNPPKDNSCEIINSSYLHNKETTSTNHSNEVTTSKDHSNEVTTSKDNSVYQPTTPEAQSVRESNLVSKSDKKPISKGLSSMSNLYVSPSKENSAEETFFNFDSGNDTVSENSSRKIRDKEIEKPLSFIPPSGKNDRSRREETTTNIAKNVYTFTEDSGLGSSVSAKTPKYKSKNNAAPAKKVEKRCGRISKKTMLQKTTSATYDAPNGVKQRKSRAAAVKSTAKTKALFQTPAKELDDIYILEDEETKNSHLLSEETEEENISHRVSKKIQETNQSFNKKTLNKKKSFLSDTENSSEISWLGGKKRKLNVPKIKHTYEKKNLKSKKTMKKYTSTSSENDQDEETKGTSHFGLKGRMYPPLKFSKAAGVFSLTRSQDKPEDPEVIWSSQKEQRKYSVGKEKNSKSKKLINRKSSGTDWSDIEKFKLTVEPSSDSKTRMRLSRSNTIIKDAQKELTQLVSEDFHDNAGIDGMVPSAEDLDKDSTVLSNSLEKNKRSGSSGKETDTTQRKNDYKGLYGLAIENTSGKIKQKARFGTEPEYENLGRENTESLNINTKNTTDLTENKSKHNLNSTCIQEENYYKQHSLYNNNTSKENCNVRHNISHTRYPNLSSSSDELVNLSSFKRSLAKELQKKTQMLLQELASPERLRRSPFKWRESLSDLGSPDIIPPNNSPETDLILSPLGRSERFNLDTTWPNSKHEKFLMMTKPGLYTTPQETVIGDSKTFKTHFIALLLHAVHFDGIWAPSECAGAQKRNRDALRRVVPEKVLEGHTDLYIIKHGALNGERYRDEILDIFMRPYTEAIVPETFFQRIHGFGERQETEKEEQTPVLGPEARRISMLGLLSGPSSVIRPRESVLKRKYGFLENEPELSLVERSRKRLFTPEIARNSPGLKDDCLSSVLCRPQSLSPCLQELKPLSPTSFSFSSLKIMPSPKYLSIEGQETYSLLQSPSIRNQKTLPSPKSSYFQGQKRQQVKDFDTNITGTKPSFSETDVSPLKQRIGRANTHWVEELIPPSVLNFTYGKKQQAVDSPVINYWRKNMFPDVRSEVVTKKLEEQVKALSKKYVNTIQRCISTFSNQLAEYRKQVSEVIAEIIDEDHATFQVNSDLLTYLKESKNNRLKVVHKLAKLEETVQLLRLAENKLEKKLQDIQKKATLKYQQELQQVKDESYREMEKNMLKQLHHHLSAFNLFI
ncbi:synaptonemal complex protein 2-like [Limulus polyphemus]|uniref:Synaptonemal complex protein 2-like n=1 Tax=Limulus polyphemus TaxID=6850 RepID=A0ABM1T5S8_LIMPO|nr:synaptonemal complex protein 2-like [Limulus polyphemus]